MEDLHAYYEQELRFLKQMAGEFAAQYPKIAGRLQLDKDGGDPHVDRLVQASAFLAARVQRKIDDEFPEITESLLGLLYPHYLRPIPSVAIAQLRVDPEQSQTSGAVKVDAGTELHTRAAAGKVCTFRTCYPVTVWPLEVTAAEVRPAGSLGITLPPTISAVLRVEVSTVAGTPLQKLPIRCLTFHLNGESLTTHLLYEVLQLKTAQIIVRPKQVIGTKAGLSSPGFVLDPSELTPLGLTADEGVLPYSDRSFLGYRLLQEFFHFPEKFLFLQLQGLSPVAAQEFGTGFEILFCLETEKNSTSVVRLEQGVGSNSFRLGCTPIVNLFEQVAEPIRLTHTNAEYRVVPDQHRQLTTEIYSINEVSSTSAYSETAHVYQPFYSFRHSYEGDSGERFWYAHRRRSFRKGDHGTDMYLSLVDLGFEAGLPQTEVLTVKTTCTNRDLPSSLTWSLKWGEVIPDSKSQVQARLLQDPKPTVRPPMRRALQWRLISHLSLNHLSITDGGVEALQEMLKLYDFHDGENSQVSRRQITSIVNVQTQGTVSRLRSETGVTFCRGLDVLVDFDERTYPGSSVFLLASVLERFFGLYSSINSFSRLTARTSKGVLRRWGPLAGEQRTL